MVHGVAEASGKPRACNTERHGHHGSGSLLGGKKAYHGLPTSTNMCLMIHIMGLLWKNSLKGLLDMSYGASFLPIAAVLPFVGKIPFVANFPSKELI